MNYEGLKVEMKSHNGNRWIPTTIENFLEDIKITREVIVETHDKNHSPNDYTEERAIWSIRTGRVVDTPANMYRLAEGEVCPNCGAKFIKHAGALSRRDNNTYICAECGLREALEDIKNRKG